VQREAGRKNLNRIVAQSSHSTADTGKPTGIRWRESTRSMADLCALYRLDLKKSGEKVAWIEKPSLWLLLFFSIGFHASSALIQAMY
jgi:hypothetical protein